MKAPFSPYLNEMAPGLKKLIGLLRERYDYVSVLSTDSVGFQVSISQRAKSVARETMTTERGTVVRVCRDGLYSEAAFTGFDPENPGVFFREITEELDSQLELLRETGTQPYETAVLPDGERRIFAEMETELRLEEEIFARRYRIPSRRNCRVPKTIDTNAHRRFPLHQDSLALYGTFAFRKVFDRGYHLRLGQNDFRHFFSRRTIATRRKDDG